MLQIYNLEVNMYANIINFNLFWWNVYNILIKWDLFENNKNNEADKKMILKL